MMVRLLTIAGIFCWVSAISQAQQRPMYSHYMFNLFGANLAYAGSEPDFQAILSHRAQWVELNGAPRQNSLFLHSALGKKPIAAGFSALYETVGAHVLAGGEVSGTYQLNLNQRRDKLGVAIGVGVYQYGLDRAKLNPEHQNDILLAQLAWETLATTNIAALYHNKRYYAGIQVLQAYNRQPEHITSSSPRLVPHATLVGGYTFNPQSTWAFKPSFLLRYGPAVPLNAELTVAWLYDKKYWMGASYRTPGGFALLAQATVNKQFKIGYSVGRDAGTFGLVSGVSHEVSIVYAVQLFRSTVVSPRFF